jgi:hypothetical protein
MYGRESLRRLTTWALLALYGAVASGLPLPVAIPPAAGTAAARTLAGKDRSQPFPCMDKACGCDSAERCFTNCCCHTPAETLAWAKARGIEPAVIAALQRRVAVAEPALPAAACRAAAVAESSCCEPALPARPSCCTVTDLESPADDAVCSDYQSLAAEPAAPPRPDHQPAVTVVSLRAMLACNGIVAQWAAACVSLPPPEVVTCAIAWPRVGTVTIGDDPAFGMGGPPDLPPPRAS